MRNHPYSASVVDVAKATLQTEHGLDGAVVETARLIDTTITASQSAKLPAHEVQPRSSISGEAMAGLITSRKQIGAAHAEFARRPKSSVQRRSRLATGGRVRR